MVFILDGAGILAAAGQKGYDRIKTRSRGLTDSQNTVKILKVVISIIIVSISF